MQDIFQRLAERLYEKNPTLTIDEARVWVELLWEDFETTRAKAGREYEGKEMTEQIVVRWIDHYGPNLHDFLANNEKYKAMFEKATKYLH
ncbi:YfhJ family protein [Aquibacillus koreensis]|uniref:YfhJ family protein n=1 Tax=Aquibacillus koreensis TaxID=279446 RepID=A0A9X4AJ00_9BACI|nr:YfhJ family protein [Aquibacillus koreensis]MCT2534380.1 YfhJ family protein [Aquibacillus koreensis]MDC3421687.1 YfhJ family protein [Aquibacillus koreensis]